MLLDLKIVKYKEITTYEMIRVNESIDYGQ